MDRERIKLEIANWKNLLNSRKKRLTKMKEINAPLKLINVDERLVKEAENKLHSLETMLLAENCNIC